MGSRILREAELSSGAESDMQTHEAFGPPDILLRLSSENMLPGGEHLNPAVESAAVKQEIQFNERAKTKPVRKKRDVDSGRKAIRMKIQTTEGESDVFLI